MVTEENFKTHQGFDLTSWEMDPKTNSGPKSYRTLRTSTVADFTKTVADDKNSSPEQMRFWVMVNRQNKTVRPDQALYDPTMTIDEAFTKFGSREKSFRLWLELGKAGDDGKVIWPELLPLGGSNNNPILVFIKYFDLEAQTLTGVGHIYIKKHSKVSDMVPMIFDIMGWPYGPSAQPPIALYEVCSQV